MDIKKFKELVANNDSNRMKEGLKVKGRVVKKTETGVLVACEEYWFTGIILPKEVKELERNNFDLAPGTMLEAEVLSTDIMDEEGYYTISISKLLQHDVWKGLIEKYKNDEIITVRPSEVNLWWLLIDIHGIKWFIPLSQLAPVNYPRVEDGDQEKIFDALLSLMLKEFQVRIINLDEDGKRMILSEREALREEREKIMASLDIGNEYEWIISWVSSYWLFVTIGWGIEWLVHISEITYWHVDNIGKFWKVGGTVKVKVIGFEDGKISLSLKQLKPDPWSLIPRTYKIGDIMEWEVIRYVPYWAFIRVFDDINWLVHISEITDKAITNPAEVLKLGQVVKARVILLEPEKRKIGLSIKAAKEGASTGWDKPARPAKPRTIKKPVAAQEGQDAAPKTEKPKTRLVKKSAETPTEKSE